MKLTEFTAVDFRNLQQVRLEPSSRFNIIEGHNGAGKTNILEGIYLLSSLKTFRPGTNSDFVRFDTSGAEIRAIVEHQETTRTLRMSITPKGRKIWVDGKVVRKASAALGQLTVVLFAPEDLALSKGSPSGRRKFLDRAIYHRWPSSLDTFKRYAATLKQRNALLKADGDDSLLDIFDEQLAQQAFAVLTWRRKYLTLYAPILTETVRMVTDGELAGAIQYDSSKGCDSVEEWLRLYHRVRRQDRARRTTTCGPHVDDLSLTIGNHSAKLYASQGQHRALVLAMKIAEIRLLQNELGYSPVLLLDDVSSELDATECATKCVSQ